MFDGLSDIQNKTLRCIGNPNERFSEDALRILRALRFSAKLDFSVEPETAEAAVALRGLLERISAERITDELEKMFETAYPARLYSVLCEFRPILSQIFPETAFVSESEYIALCDITSRLPSGACVQAFKDLRFAYFIAVSGFLDALLKRLRVPTAFAKRVKALAEILPLAGTACDRSVHVSFWRGSAEMLATMQRLFGQQPTRILIFHNSLKFAHPTVFHLLLLLSMEPILPTSDFPERR